MSGDSLDPKPPLFAEPPHEIKIIIHSYKPIYGRMFFMFVFFLFIWGRGGGRLLKQVVVTLNPKPQTPNPKP